MSRLEHVNITVPNPKATAQTLIDLFDWHIRWEGEAMDGAGYTVHVGNDDDYLALYSGSGPLEEMDEDKSYHLRGGLNHIGIVVDDLEAAEKRVKDHGYKAGSHYDYEPGRRFYFDDNDGIEFEVICYDA